MLKKMVIPGESIAEEEEESEDTDDTDRVDSHPGTVPLGNINKKLVHHHRSIFPLLENLKRKRRIEDLFIKVME